MDKKFKIYTDGSCRVHSTKHGSWAYVIIDEEDGSLLYEDSGFVDSRTTSPEMELMAVVEGVSQAINCLPHGSITVYCDNEVVVKGITKWIDNWKKRNWKTSSGSVVFSKNLWMVLDQMTNIVDVDFQWVKGHDGNQWNEYVHNLADEARYK